MRDTGGFAGQPGSQFGISRSHQSPCINENLTAYLLCNRVSVLRDAAASGSGYAASEVQIGRMLCRNAVPSPPEEAMFKGSVVEQRVSHILCCQLLWIVRMQQCPQEEQGPVAVIIRGEVVIIRGVVRDFPICALDLLIVPTLNRRTQANANNLCKPSGVQSVEVVGWNHAHLFPSVLVNPSRFRWSFPQ